MPADYSKSALLTFLEMASEKGLMQPSTANARQVAVSRLLTDLTEGEEADVRTIDINLAAQKLANRSGGDISAETLMAYRRRAGIAIDEFVAWMEDPEGYQSGDTDRRGRRGFWGPKGEFRPASEEDVKHLREARGGKHKRGEGEHHPPTEEEVENLREARRGGRHGGRGFGGGRPFGFGGMGGDMRSAGLPLPFPLRPDFVAQLVVPRDLTTAEAKRLGAFLLTLASDYEPTV